MMQQENGFPHLSSYLLRSSSRRQSRSMLPQLRAMFASSYLRRTHRLSPRPRICGPTIVMMRVR